MNDTFSIKRFALLFKKTIAERPIQTVGVMVLLLLLSFILYVVAKKNHRFRSGSESHIYLGISGRRIFFSLLCFWIFQ